MTSEGSVPAPRDASWSAGVISYAGPPAASKRLLDLDLRRTLAAKRYQPSVGIDGQSYVCAWGRCRFEIPADRPVHVSVQIEHRRPVGAASLVLNPDQSSDLDYAAPANLSYPGALGPRGSTSARGRGMQGCLLVGLGLAVLLLVVFVTAIAISVMS